MAMCRAAVAQSPWIDVDPWETQQAGHSYTRDVLARFEKVLFSSAARDTSISLTCR